MVKYGVDRVDAKRGVRFNLVFRGEGAKSCCHPSREHDALISSLLPILFLVCVAAGVKEHFENSGCKVKSCKPLFLLLDDACVLESSVSTTTTGSLDVEGVVNAVLGLGGISSLSCVANKISNKMPVQSLG